jgi:hypothetical protein
LQNLEHQRTLFTGVRDEEEKMIPDLRNELSYQRIAQLHADAERDRQVQVSKRRRARRSRTRLGRLGRLFRPGLASWANDVLGGIVSPPWPSRRDTLGPSRVYPSLGR